MHFCVYTQVEDTGGRWRLSFERVNASVRMCVCLVSVLLIHSYLLRTHTRAYKRMRHLLGRRDGGSVRGSRRGHEASRGGVECLSGVVRRDGHHGTQGRDCQRAG